MLWLMGLPNTPVTLTPEQLTELNQKLSHMRHEINNQLALIVAALELVRIKPDLRDKMLDTLGQQPPKISGGGRGLRAVQRGIDAEH